MIKSIQSELLKLKYPPLLWLIAFVVGITLVIVFTAYNIDINRTVLLGRNPWLKLNAVTEAIFAMFMSVPFIVLFISSAIHVEHENYGFKQLYTFPKSRETLISYKLTAFLSVLLMAVFILIVGNILIGYLVNLIYPEAEFAYFDLPLLDLIKDHIRIVISLLGIIGIQFFLSLRFKGFLLPATIGILAYIVGLILSSIGSTLSIYCPYSYPVIARNREMMNTSVLKIDQSAFLNKVELLSIAVFFVFVVFALYSERKKNI